MKYILLFVMFLSGPFCFSQTNIGSGSVSGIWSISGSPYIVQGNIKVDSLSSLTIEPGVEVVFAGYYGLIVKGSLLAEGTGTDMVKFDVADTTGFADTTNAGAWKGILIINQSNASSARINYCSVKHTKAAEVFYGGITSLFSDSVFHSGALCVVGSPDVRIENSEISWNKGINLLGIPLQGIIWSGAVLTSECDVIIDNNHIHHNELQCGIAMIYMANGVISNNDIHDNSNESGGGIGCYDQCSPSIVQNEVHHNTATVKDGGGIYVYISSSPDIISNRIHNNICEASGGGILVKNGSTPRVISNLIANNLILNANCGVSDGGAGIRVSGSGVVLIQNNIIVNNSIPFFNGGGIQLYGARVHCFNNIIANNSASKGGGLYTFNDDSSLVVNTIFSGNDAVLGSDWGSFDTVLTTSITNCNVESLFSNFWSFWSNTITDTTNISSYSPQFISPSMGPGTAFSGVSADWHSAVGTGLVDGGVVNPGWAQLYPADYDGMLRVQGAAIDIGPFEEGELESIGELKDALKLIVFPNPTDGSITILRNGESISSMHLYDNGLHEINIAWEIEKDSIRIDLDSLAKGLYILSVQFESGAHATTRLIRR